MTTVISHMTMSLDGFIADPDDDVAGLFDWYDAGDMEVPSANPGIDFHPDPASADLVAEMTAGAGALVSGRRLFDIANGWGDQHPIGCPVVVVTHRPVSQADQFPNTTFVPDVETAISTAAEIAGEKSVIVASASLAAQALELGLLNEIWVSLVPILLGRGIPYFTGLTTKHRLEDPEVTVGMRATHLRYRVRPTG